MSVTWSKARARVPLLLLAAAVGLACSGDSTGTSDPDPTPEPDPDTDVVINLTQSLTFDPANVTIDAGTTVEWVSAYEEAHTITPEDQNQEGVWDRQEMPGAGSFQHTFDVAGETYDYFCEQHAGMTGTITVE